MDASPRRPLALSTGVLRASGAQEPMRESESPRSRHEQAELALGLTPGLQSRELPPQHQHRQQRAELDFRHDTFWRSCCGIVVDKRAVQYIVQVVVTLLVLTFCIGKILTSDGHSACSGEDLTVYFSLMSAIVGYYIPAPRLLP